MTATNATNDTGFTGPLGQFAGEHLRMLPRFLLPGPPRPSATADTSWWEKPGIGVMYMIEHRPGWEWERDFAEFNRSITDPSTGGIQFDGPRCDVDQFMKLSHTAQADYHTFQSKWHDGICYFGTETTRWTSDQDYVDQFAKLSRENSIPFLLYYSSAVDHNPQFDDMQPDRHATLSLLGGEDNEYTRYIVRHHEELVSHYCPDGMWFDWFWPDRSTEVTLEWFRTHAPETLTTFNISNFYPSRANKLKYTTGEIHALDGPIFGQVDTVRLPTNCWFWARWYRNVLERPWELLVPAGSGWQTPPTRDELDELLRIAAVTLACGGKLHVGATVMMEGQVHPEQVTQLTRLGEWYGPRKDLFARSSAVRRWGWPGARAWTEQGDIRSLAGLHDGALLVHLINMIGRSGTLDVRVELPKSKEITSVSLEPGGEKISFQQRGRSLRLTVPADLVDSVDTILRIEAQGGVG